MATAGCEPCRELREPPRRGRGGAEESFGSGSLGQPFHDERAPCKGDVVQRRSPGFASPAFDERDDSLIIHGHGARDERVRKAKNRA